MPLVGKLVVRNVQQLGQLYPIRGCLVQHDEKIAVYQHVASSVGLEKVLHILRDTSHTGTVLSHTFPEGKQEVCAVLMLEQQIDLINIYPGMPLCLMALQFLLVFDVLTIQKRGHKAIHQYHRRSTLK